MTGSRVPEHLVFEFEIARDHERSAESGPPDAAIDVVGSFRLFAGAAVIYSDPEMPLLDLALQLDHWRKHAADTGMPFSYDGASALPGVIRISFGAEGWYFSSVYQEFASSACFALDEVLAAVGDFADRVFADVAALRRAEAGTQRQDS